MRDVSATAAGTLALAISLLIMTVAARAQVAGFDAPPPDATASAAPTPRTSNGHPDLSGYWGGGGGIFAGGDSSDPGVITVPLRNGDFANLTNDTYIRNRASDNLPLYKPQYWAQIAQNERNGEKLDPFNSCMPITPPRLGPPTKIVQLFQEVIFFYRVPFQPNTYREIPIGPPAYPVDPDGTWMGDPAAHWDGDTLVVETVGYNDQSWLSPQGYMHGFNLKTVERLRRTGNVLQYDVTIEDSDYLQRPWVLPTQRVSLTINPHAWLEESPPCDEHDLAHLVGPNQEQ